MTRARILLADDHKEMRDTVEHLLASEFDIVGVVADGEELLKTESETHPDVCVLDISMPKMSGIDAANRLRAEGSRTKIVFLTVHDDPDFLQAALDTGALGYVLKSRIVADLSRAIESVLNGQLFISPSRQLDHRS
ncbi:MAG TPA: response regulator transcription factor [Pyrinomonadaceae bacterium]|nr:response regulator transcription factor [Pyrinomonadaceae bacterium]